jgi:uncharacterized membrane protein YhhN
VTSAAWAVLAATAVVALGDWIARARDDRRLEYVCKPLATIGLLTLALVLEPADPTVRAFFVVAVGLSLVGDVALMLPSDRFVLGLGAFLLAHVAYIAGLATMITSPVAVILAAVILAVVTAPIARRILAAVSGGMRVAVGVYLVAVVGTPVAAAAAGDLLATGGALAFLASDALIGWNRFVQPLGVAPVAIMALYHLGQTGLVLSLVG